MNTKFAAIAALGALSLAAGVPQAAAADNGFYIGAGITRTDFDISVDDFDGEVSLDDSSFKIIAGFRPLDWLAVEANYIDLGEAEFDDSDLSIETRAITASALFIKEWQVIDIFARIGMANWDSDFNVGGGDSASDDGWEPTYGVGIGAHFGSIGLRAEYEMFSTEALDDLVDTDISTVSLSFTYTFL